MKLPRGDTPHFSPGLHYLYTLDFLEICRAAYPGFDRSAQKSVCVGFICPFGSICSVTTDQKHLLSSAQDLEAILGPAGRTGNY